MDLTLTQTLLNFTALKWHVPHGGGAFPATIDRFLGFTNQPAELQARNRDEFATRMWWDVAGPVFPRQVLGLLAYGVPTGKLVYGSVRAYVRMVNDSWLADVDFWFAGFSVRSAFDVSV